MSRRRTFCFGFVLLLGAPGVNAGTIEDVRKTGVLHCGAVPRAGLFEVAPDGSAHGLLAEICRAVAAAVQPTGIRVAFDAYDSALAFEALRQGRDEVAFLTATEIVENKLADAVVPGPPVFFETTSVMVPQGSQARALRELAGEALCSEDGGAAQRHLEAFFAAAHLAFVRMPFREEGEMIDAYNVRACFGLAAETTTLAALRGDGGIDHLQSRILPDPLAAYPILAVTGTGDGRWSALVAWVVHTLVRAEVGKKPWTAGGLDALPIAAPALGLTQGWQARVVAKLGSYRALFERTLGAGSPYRLPRGPNAPIGEGGLMVAPFLE